MESVNQSETDVMQSRLTSVVYQSWDTTKTVFFRENQISLNILDCWDLQKKIGSEKSFFIVTALRVFLIPALVRCGHVGSVSNDTT